MRNAEYYRDLIKANVVIDDNGCWLWQGKRHAEPSSYGYLSAFSKHWRVHRLAYKLWNGELDPAKDVCHTCDVKHCCNPAHLWLGTPKENMRDAAKKKIWSRQHQTHCKRGHEFTPENTSRFPSNPNRRRCNQCQLERVKSPKYRAKALERQRARRARILQGQL